MQVKQKKRNRKRGARAWLTRGELIQKYGSQSVADAIIAAKISDTDLAKEHVRAHPDMHGVMTEALWRHQIA